MILTEKYIGNLESLVRSALRNDMTGLAAFEELALAYEETRLAADESKQHFLKAILEIVTSINDITSRATAGIAPSPTVMLPMFPRKSTAPHFEVLPGGK